MIRRRPSYAPPEDGEVPGDWNGNDTPHTIRINKIEREMRTRIIRWVLGAAIASITTLGGGALLLKQLGLFNIRDGLGVLSKEQYVEDRKEDKTWRDKIESKIDMLLEKVSRGRR